MRKSSRTLSAASAGTAVMLALSLSVPRCCCLEEVQIRLPPGELKQRLDEFAKNHKDALMKLLRDQPLTPEEQQELART